MKLVTGQAENDDQTGKDVFDGASTLSITTLSIMTIM